jgi:hypothetical protein
MEDVMTEDIHNLAAESLACGRQAKSRKPRRISLKSVMKAAGERSVAVAPDGTMTVAPTAETSASPANEWDEVFSRDTYDRH